MSLESQTSVSLSFSPGGDEGANSKYRCQNKNGGAETKNPAPNEITDKSNSKGSTGSNVQSMESTHSPSNENESGFSVECSPAATFTSEDNFEMETSIAKDAPPGDITDYNVVPQMKSSSPSSSQNRTTVPADVVQPLLIYDENSNSNDANCGRPTAEKLMGSTGKGREGSPSINSTTNSTSKDISADFNPSMESTYVNDAANSIVIDAPSSSFPSQDTWADIGSTPKELSDSPYLDSSEFSMEYSLLEKDRICDLETLPFTAITKSGMCITDGSDLICILLSIHKVP